MKRKPLWTLIAVGGLFLALAACGGGEAPEGEESAAAAEEAYAPATTGAVAESPEASAVAQLNEMCPDNWCMGDYRYRFETLTCGEASCTLGFTAEGAGGSRQGSVDVEFDLPLVDEFGDLEVSYFERVTDALDEWEPAQAG